MMLRVPAPELVSVSLDQRRARIRSVDRRGLWVLLPFEANPARRRKRRYDRRRYRRRNVIQRFFRKIKGCRRVATRYDKKPQNYAAFVCPAAGMTAAA